MFAAGLMLPVVAASVARARDVSPRIRGIGGLAARLCAAVGRIRGMQRDNKVCLGRARGVDRVVQVVA